MNGAIWYEGTGGVGGSPDGVVMIDKIVNITEDDKHHYTLIHLVDGGLIRSQTSVAELRGRINSLLGGREL